MLDPDHKERLALRRDQRERGWKPPAQLPPNPEVMPKVVVTKTLFGREHTAHAALAVGTKATTDTGEVFYLHEDGTWQETPPRRTRGIGDGG